MSLANFVATIARGPSRGRSLTVDEAHAAMTVILTGEAEPEAIGAFLMVLRYRGETPEELAGFSLALRDVLPGWTGAVPAVDWPCYAAGRTRGLPWFLLSARLVALAGLPVLLHGWNAFQTPVASVRDALPGLGIPVAATPDEAGTLLRDHGIAYLPLEAMSRRVFDLIRLREVLGLRSILNTAVRMMNPGHASCVVQGVFHPAYRPLQQEAARIVGLQNLAIIKGGGGEFERHPAKDVTVYGLREGAEFREAYPALRDDHRRLSESTEDPAALDRLWRGESTEPFATAIVLGTAALALEARGAAAPGGGLDLARRLWADRAVHVAA
ncbi:glycosyl transferase family protein [Sulfitobacter sp. D35]|uniref:glycosyl transferase family protein n=1 Tax=Sulfitobacter sp. D35 TaxID=3083252 RepID=UPI00296E83D6|nr:glycosyl transferase family protein [Sulfitobacter sp. D35]MDW4498914.1 glycosyl transferase family protein [Sulfitobacter sp. D35]